MFQCIAITLHFSTQIVPFWSMGTTSSWFLGPFDMIAIVFAIFLGFQTYLEYSCSISDQKKKKSRFTNNSGFFFWEVVFRDNNLGPRVLIVTR